MLMIIFETGWETACGREAGSGAGDYLIHDDDSEDDDDDDD